MWKPLDKRKLAMVLGMLGSAHDGEIAAAGRQATTMLRTAGLTWHDVIKPDFDKATYQRSYMREYMRKRRANERAANAK